MDKLSPRSSALRKGRYSEPGRIYHITTSTHKRTPLFADFYLARAVVRQLRQCDTTGCCSTLCYVLMPDHLHWLFQLQDGNLAALVGRLKARAASEVNHYRGSRGAVVWQQGYYDHALRCDEDLREVARYIVANPLRAGLVSSVRTYPHWDAIWL